MSITQGWHFLASTRKLGWDQSATSVVAGGTYSASGPINVRSKGLHIAARAIDPLIFEIGPVACWDTISGTTASLASNGYLGELAAATSRTVVAIADATNVLHAWAVRCARDVISRTGSGSLYSACDAALTAKTGWLASTVTTGDLATARNAAIAEWSSARTGGTSRAALAAAEAAWCAARVDPLPAARAGRCAWSSTVLADPSSASSAIATYNAWLEADLFTLLGISDPR